MRNSQAAILLSDEEAEHLARIMDTMRRVQKVLDACLETGSVLLEELREMSDRHGIRVHERGGELVPLRVAPDVAPPSRCRPD